MDNSLIQPYNDALSAQKARLEGFMTRGLQAISVPASASEIESSKLHFLGKSAVWFLGLGIVAFVAGLFASSMGIIIAGAAAITSGCYLWVKGKQASHAEAFDSFGESVYGKIASVVDQISSDWQAFTKRQNDSLKLVIVGSSAADDDKVSMIDKVEASPAVAVDLDAIKGNVEAAEATENIKAFDLVMSKAQTQIQSAINSVDAAQQSIYASIGTPAAATAKAATDAASATAKAATAAAK